MISPRILVRRPSVLLFAVLALSCIFVTGSAFHIQTLNNEWTQFSINNADGSEAFYLAEAAKYESYGRPALAESTLHNGQIAHPHSEAIANALGIRMLKNENYIGAEQVLLATYNHPAFGQPTDGTMENNIAWAMMHRADQSIEQTVKAANFAHFAMKREPLSCEILHTNIAGHYALSQLSHNGNNEVIAADAMRTLSGLLLSYRNDARCYERNRSWEVMTENLSVVFIRRELMLATHGRASKLTSKLQIAKAHLRDNFNGAEYGSATIGIPHPSLKQHFQTTLQKHPSAWWDYTSNRKPFSLKTDDVDPKTPGTTFIQFH